MTKTLAIVAVAGALATPALAFAQSSNEPVTRAQVRADLIQMEQAGYNPADTNNPHYPDQIQAAEARVDGQNNAQMTSNAMGGVQAGSSASGAPESTYMATRYTAYPSARDSYGSYGSQGAYGCQGPRSFCDKYSGGR